jgi:hypothetical protein
MKHLQVAAAIDDQLRHAVAAKEQANLGQGLVVETDRQWRGHFEWFGPFIRQRGAGDLSRRT